MLMNNSIDILWSALPVLFDGLASVMAVIAVTYSVITFRKTLEATHYGELDNQYHNLLSMALERPHCYYPEQISTQREQQEYDIYAFMLWNFLEAIYDRGQDNRSLMETWEPIITTEGLRHLRWFNRIDNQPRFKHAFRSYVEQTLANHSNLYPAAVDNTDTTSYISDY